MAALAGIIHEGQGAAGPERNRRENNQKGGFHRDLATVVPPNYPTCKINRGPNEHAMNASQAAPFEKMFFAAEPENRFATLSDPERTSIGPLIT